MASLRGVFQKKNGIFWEFFPKWGGGHLEVKMSTKDTSFHSFFAFFSLLEKTETLDKKGDPHTKKGPL